MRFCRAKICVVFLLFILGGATESRGADAELYPQIVEKYMNGEWDALETLLTQKVKDLPTLPKDQAADVAYIRLALLECHPAWWNTVKAGNKVQIRPTIWGRTMTMTYDPELTGNFQINSSSTALWMLVNWSAADIENPAIAEHGYSKGDLANVNVWNVMANAEIYASLGTDRLRKLTDVERKQLERFVGFRGALTAGYFGTPRGRTWSTFLALDGFLQSHLTSAGFIPRKPLGAMVVAEVVSHPARYPSLKLPARPPADNVEQRLANQLMPQFERKLTFAEDKALREAIKVFTGSNGMTVFTTGRVTLPSKLQMALDPEQDADLSAKREVWLKEQLANPGTAPATRGATSGPASGPATRTTTGPGRGRN